MGEEVFHGGRRKTVFELPSVRRDVVYASSPGRDDPVVRGAACHPFIDELWLLTNEPRRRILSVSVADEALADPGSNLLRERLTADDHPYVATANSIKAALSERGGLVFIVQHRFFWVPRIHEPFYQELMMPQLVVGTPSPEPCVLSVADRFLDGRAFACEELTDSEFIEAYSGTWDDRFPEH